jgi:hypothetical protein
MIKFKNGLQCIVSDFDWANMSTEQQALYTNSPDEVGVIVQEIDIENDIEKIQIVDREKEALQKRIAELEAQLSGKSEIIEEKDVDFDVWKLDANELKTWLQSNDIEFPARVTKLETLQKYIPDGNKA